MSQEQETSSLKDKAIATVKAIAKTYTDLWRDEQRLMVYVHVGVVILVFVAWLLWPVRIEPSPEFTNQQNQAKQTISDSKAVAENYESDAAQVEKEAEKGVESLKTQKKGISKAKEKVNEKQIKVDFSANGDVSDVPGNSELCTRAKNAGIRCDTDR